MKVSLCFLAVLPLLALLVPEASANAPSVPVRRAPVSKPISAPKPAPIRAPKPIAPKPISIPKPVVPKPITPARIPVPKANPRVPTPVAKPGKRAPAVPKAPKVPAVPKAPKAPKTNPRAPAVPKTNPNAPKTPKAPKTPAVPKTNPKAPRTPKAPKTPAVPKTNPKTPVAPKTNPKTPVVPKTPTNPAPKTPKAPNAPVSKGGNGIVEAASKWDGTPYSYGGGSLDGPAKAPSGRGKNTVGFDCSSLARYSVLKATGKTLPRTADEQYHSKLCTHVPYAQRQAGDLVFWQEGSKIGHVGIVADKDQMWHAPHTGDHVKKAAIFGDIHTKKTNMVRMGEVARCS